MPLWTAKPVSEQPEIILSKWRIFETPEGTRHFVGKNLTGNGTGRVSSAITVFDKTSMTGVTRSGRVYQLLGDPGYNDAAAYVWGVWCAHNAVPKFEDITEQFSVAPLASLDSPESLVALESVKMNDNLRVKVDYNDS